MATNTWIGATGSLSSTWDTGKHWSLGTVPLLRGYGIDQCRWDPRVYSYGRCHQHGCWPYDQQRQCLVKHPWRDTNGFRRYEAVGGLDLLCQRLRPVNTATFTQTGGTFSGSRGKFTVTGAGTALSISDGAFNEAAAATITVSNAASFSGGRTSIGGTFTAGQILLGGSSTTVSVSATGRLITNVDDPTANVIDIGDTLRMATGSVVDFTGAGASTGAGVLDNGTILGSGTLSGVVSGAGVVEASGGKLELTGDIADPSIVFNIDGGTSILQLDAGVGNGNSFNFNDPTSGGIVYNSAVTGISLAITGMNVGAGTTTPTNFLDFSQYTVSVVGDSAFSGDTATISLSDGSTLTLDQVADASAT